jgi:hypothetical protein
MARPDSSEGGQMKTTEQLVRDCFCNDSCSCFPCAAPDYYDCPQWKLFSRAARRFVKAEQREMSVDKLGDEIERLMRLANSKERKRNEND